MVFQVGPGVALAGLAVGLQSLPAQPVVFGRDRPSEMLSIEKKSGKTD
jgi:hypothetical protein